MARILVIDDEVSIHKLLSVAFQRDGHSVTGIRSLREGVNAAATQEFDVVFLDVNFPEGNGLEELPKILSASDAPEVIIITGLGDADGAALAMQCGAWDYVQKRASIKSLELALKRALQYRETKLREKVRLTLNRESIIGDSLPIRRSLDKLALAAAAESNVLLWGETGTGKDLFARAIHANSARADEPFIIVDCGAIPDALVESTLFGHARGAFTGADSESPGLVKQADGGTLFLDEVGELPLGVQSSFLRLLDQHSFYPVGVSKPRYSNFRLISATNRNLEKMVEQGSFRRDLYFRLSAYRIDLPPLRDRIGDIEAIVSRYLQRQAGSGAPKSMVPEFMAILQQHNWPGNVRELLNVLSVSLETAGDMPVLFPAHLPTQLRSDAAVKEFSFPQVDNNLSTQSSEAGSVPSLSCDGLQPMREYRRACDVSYLKKLLEECNGDIQKAVNVSGMSRPRLYALLKEYGISARD